MRAAPLRLAATALVTTGLVASLVGCSSSSDDSPGTRSPSSPAPATSPSSSAPPAAPSSSAATVTITSAAPVGTPSPPAAPTSSPPTVPSTPARPAAGPCATGHLSLTVTYGGGAAGTESYTVALRNTGTSPCELHDYPGVSFTDASGRVLAVTAAREPPLRPAFTVAPGRSGSTTVTVTPNSCTGTSTRAATVRVIPPDQTTALSARVTPDALGEAPPVTVCRPAVRALVPGMSGAPLP